MIAWWAGVALALPEAYPWCAPVEVPGGTLRIEVPLELRSADDPADGSDLVLAGPDNTAVPFARIEGDPGDAERVSLVALPTSDARVFTVDIGARPIDVLRVQPPAGLVAANITVRQLDQVIAGPVLVWQLSASNQADVPLPPTVGKVTVEIAPVGDGGVYDAPGVEGVRKRGPSVLPTRITVPVGPPVLQENGFARYDFALERPLPIDRFEVQASPPVFARSAGVNVADSQPGQEAYPSNAARIERIAVGDVRAESVTVPGPGVGSQRYSLLVGTEGMDPLPVTAVVAEVDRAELLVFAAAPGAYTLCGGAPNGTSRGSDLAIATPELIRTAAGTVTPGAVTANPDYVAPEIRSNLAGPGPTIDPDRFAWKRAVEGSGLVAIPLPLDLLTTARPDLGDLRLVAGTAQIPYLLRRLPDDPALEGVKSEPWEEGGRSWVRLTLPHRGLPVVRVVLRTEAPTFSRQVTLYRPDQGNRQVLRSVQWQSGARPHSLGIELLGPLDDTLLVAIDNGDDPPLPLDPIEVQTAGWELVAVLPDGGATLLYGAPPIGPPDYDLVLLADDLQRRVTATAVLSPAEPARRGALTTPDRLLLAAGLGVLALGLAGLAFELLRRLPSEGVPPSEPA